jgi:hypothetical protein
VDRSLPSLLLAVYANFPLEFLNSFLMYLVSLPIYVNFDHFFSVALFLFLCSVVDFLQDCRLLVVTFYDLLNYVLFLFLLLVEEVDVYPVYVVSHGDYFMF